MPPVPTPTPFVVALKPRQLRALGHVTAQWAFLELQLDFALAGMLRTSDKDDKDKFLILPFKKRGALWRATVNKLVKEKPLKTALLSIMERARRLQHRRDVLVHGQWMLGRRKPVLTRNVYMYRHAEALKVYAGEYSWRDMEKLAHEIACLSGEFHAVAYPRNPYFVKLPLPRHR